MTPSKVTVAGRATSRFCDVIRSPRPHQIALRDGSRLTEPAVGARSYVDILPLVFCFITVEVPRNHAIVSQETRR